LGGYLVIRIRKWGRDNRFDEIRNNFGKFAGFWLFQAITAFVVLTSSLIYFYQNESSQFSIYHLLGASLFLSALLFESVADIQLYKFTSKNENKGKFIDKGLWRFSRHPNYFGEISVWLSLWLYAFPALTTTLKVVGFISPLFIFTMIRFFSGVPMLEAKAEKKWGTDKDYKEYKKRTGLIIPKFW
jgi:steroid 5-alpha reductase family enzyme